MTQQTVAVDCVAIRKPLAMGGIRIRCPDNRAIPSLVRQQARENRRDGRTPDVNQRRVGICVPQSALVRHAVPFTCRRPLPLAAHFGRLKKKMRASFKISRARHRKEPVLKYQERARRTGTLREGMECPLCTGLRSHILRSSTENFRFSLEAKNALAHI